MRGKDGLVVAGAVCSSRDHTGESLVRDGSEVDHSQAMRIENCMQALEDDAALRDDVALFGVDLHEDDQLDGPNAKTLVPVREMRSAPRRAASRAARPEPRVQ